MSFLMMEVSKRLSLPLNLVKAMEVGHMSRYELQDMIGSGSYGSVYKAYDKQTGKTVAIKEMNLEEKQYVIEEYKILEHITKNGKDCLNLVCYLEMFEENNKLYLVMDYIDGGNLTKQIYMPRDTKQMMGYMIPLLQALATLESYHVAHLDIKTENIVIRKKDNKPILVDFGFACSVERNEFDHCTSWRGTDVYLSPEMALLKIGELRDLPQEAYIASDVWSLGIVFLELLRSKQIEKMGFGYIDFDKGHKATKPLDVEYSKLLKLLGSFPRVKNPKTKIAHAINMMLTPDYRKRPSAKEVLKYLQGSWDVQRRKR
jgi:serine/threonine protein kinase